MLEDCGEVSARQGIQDHSINSVKYAELKSALEFKASEVKQAFREARSRLKRDLMDLELRRHNAMKKSTTYKELGKQVIFLESQISSLESSGKSSLLDRFSSFSF